MTNLTAASQPPRAVCSERPLQDSDEASKEISVRRRDESCFDVGRMNVLERSMRCTTSAGVGGMNPATSGRSRMKSNCPTRCHSSSGSSQIGCSTIGRSRKSAAWPA